MTKKAEKIEKKLQTKVYLTRDQLNGLRKVSSKRGLSVSELVRDLVTVYLTFN